MTVSNMLRMAFESAEAGAINFNILNSLLYTVVKKWVLLSFWKKSTAQFSDDAELNISDLGQNNNNNNNNNDNTVFQKKLVHQAHIDNLVNSQRIFKILSLTHSAENLL